MKREQETGKNKDLTQRRIVQALGELIDEQGFEKIGINAVAERAGVAKVLIYRYFGGIDELTAHYIAENDYWINLSPELPENLTFQELSDFLKNLFSEQIHTLRNNNSLRKLYRWELSADNAFVAELRQRRETNALQLIKAVSRLTARAESEVSFIATLISASVSYLALLQEHCPVYNNIAIQTDEGWSFVENGINTLIDKWIKG